jgi:hypothetical protein
MTNGNGAAGKNRQPHHIDTPRRACLESRCRLGASNPPLAGIMAAQLTLGANRRFGDGPFATWIALSGEPGNGFVSHHNRDSGRKAGVGASAFVMPVVGFSSNGLSPSP